VISAARLLPNVDAAGLDAWPRRSDTGAHDLLEHGAGGSIRNVKALVADDNAKTGHFTANVLREQGHTVEECWTGADALRLLRLGGHALVVLDVALGDSDGFAVTREAREIGVRAPILMLGATTNVKDRVHGLESGADDFMVKPFAMEEFLARVRALLRRRGDRATLTVGALVVDRVRGTAALGGRPLRMTTRELAVLLYLMDRQGELVTRIELLAGVWDAAFEASSNAIDVHLCHVRAKLGDQAWMIETVRGKGYRFRSERRAVA
jgi:DNA-binding response OmpR family regulator